jgi:hypothetical protein
MEKLNELYWGVCVRSDWWAKETLESHLRSSDPQVVNLAKLGIQSLKSKNHREAVKYLFEIFGLLREGRTRPSVPGEDIFGED